MTASPYSLPLHVALALHAGLLIAGPSCTPEDVRTADDVSGLPRWEGHARDVFDDQIEPAAVGLADGGNPRLDPLLHERAKTAAVVARVQVSTVTVETIDDTVRYHLVIQVIPPPLAEPKLSDRSFDLLIRSSSQAYGIAKAFDTRLRGSTFIGFVQRFVDAHGEPEVHWHLCPDTAEVLAAVKDAVALAELGGS